MSPVKMPFALDENNKVVHIFEVKKGKKCNCICPDCGSALIASKGLKQQQPRWQPKPTRKRVSSRRGPRINYVHPRKK